MRGLAAARYSAPKLWARGGERSVPKLPRAIMVGLNTYGKFFGGFI